MNQTESEDVIRSVRGALAEDVGQGDLTAALIPHDAYATASIILREPRSFVARRGPMNRFDSWTRR